MMHGAVADRTLPSPAISAGEDVWSIDDDNADEFVETNLKDGAWNENAAKFEVTDTLEDILALDGDGAQEAEDTPIAAEAADNTFPTADADRRDDEILHDLVAAEVHVAPGGGPPVGWRVGG